MFETESVGPFSVRKLKWRGGPWPPWPPSGYAPAAFVSLFIRAHNYDF